MNFDERKSSHGQYMTLIYPTWGARILFDDMTWKGHALYDAVLSTVERKSGLKILT